MKRWAIHLLCAFMMLGGCVMEFEAFQESRLLMLIAWCAGFALSWSFQWHWRHDCTGRRVGRDGD